MVIIWHGTAGIEMRSGADRILFDPFLPLRGSEIKIDIQSFDGIEHIFVTHGHIDHVYSLPKIAGRNPNAKIYCTQTPFHTLCKKGVGENQLIRIDYREKIRVGSIELEPYHGKHAVLPKINLKNAKAVLKRKPLRNLPMLLFENRRCPEHDETAAYKVVAEGKTILLLGSMNLRQEIEYPQGVDVLVLPYNGWEDNFAPAAEIIDRIRPKRVLLDHFDDTFPPLTEHVDTAPIRAHFPGLVTELQVGKETEV